MRLSIVAAVSFNGVIGRNNKIPWRLPTDLLRLKNLTLGHTVIMGRKTYESIPLKFRPLPERRNIVLSRQLDYRATGAEVIHSLTELETLVSDVDVFVLGGSEIYQITLPLAQRIYLTVVNCRVAGDTFFPIIDSSVWRLKSITTPTFRLEDEYPFVFNEYEKVV